MTDEFDPELATRTYERAEARRCAEIKVAGAAFRLSLVLGCRGGQHVLPPCDDAVVEMAMRSLDVAMQEFAAIVKGKPGQ